MPLRHPGPHSGSQRVMSSTSTQRPPHANRHRAWVAQLVTGAVVLLAGIGAAVFILASRGAAQAKWVEAALVTAVFTVIAWRLRGVDASGALAGAGVTLALYSSVGLRGFALLVSVFAVTWISTRLGRRRKQSLNLVRDAYGRTATQVVANTWIAALFALLWSARPDFLLMLPMVAALAEAAADTVSSECGEAWGGHARLITTLRPAPVGVNGAVSLQGTLAGVAAAVLTAGVAVSISLLSVRGATIAATAGVLGSLFDSVLGATVERRYWLNNDAVNLLGTLAAALLALACGSGFHLP